jgi:hypothetical protein
LSWPESRHLAAAVTDGLVSGCVTEFGRVTLVVTGDCMAPSLRAGDRVQLERRAPTIGDVVLARHARGLSLHRLVWRPPFFAPRAWRTKADRALLFDERLDPTAILATVVAVEGRTPPRSRWRALRSLTLGIVTRVRRLFSR